MPLAPAAGGKCPIRHVHPHARMGRVNDRDIDICDDEDGIASQLLRRTLLACNRSHGGEQGGATLTTLASLSDRNYCGRHDGKEQKCESDDGWLKGMSRAIFKMAFSKKARSRRLGVTRSR
jgi:hypothetical protein